MKSKACKQGLARPRMRPKKIRSPYEDKLDKLQRYAGVLRGLVFDLIAKLQGDETPLEVWSLEDMYEALKSQVSFTQ